MFFIRDESPITHNSIVTCPRFGQISFINSLPIVLPLERGKVSLDAEFFCKEPGELNAAIQANQLDVSAVSSFYYLQNNSLVLIPGVSISCLNEVGSVLLFSKRDPQLLKDSTILVPKTSATSVALLKILLAEKYGASPRLITQLTEHDGNGCDAACLFGDDALASDAAWSKNYQRYDLGSWWRELTGLPMVFAVWVATQNWSNSHPQSIDTISSALQESAHIGLAEMFNDVLSEANHRSKIHTARLTKYYKEQLNYDLGQEHLKALETFRELCVKHKLLAY
jgi:chorismate dehydratase